MAKTSFDLTGTPMKMVYSFLGIVLILLFGSELLPEVNTALANISGIENLPLSGLFSPGGVIMMIIVAVLIVAVIKSSQKITK